jgi:curved DNA-binding protein CbpA
MTGTRDPDAGGTDGLGDDLYAILGASPDAEIGELTSAYRRRLRQLHPDTQRQHRGCEEHAGQPEASLAQVLHAYAVLRDPARRAGYDRARAARQQQRCITDEPPPPWSPSPTAVRIPVHQRGAPTSSPAWVRVGPVRHHLGPQ